MKNNTHTPLHTTHTHSLTQYTIDNPQQLAYKFPEYPYASLETINGEAPEDMLHTRDKTAAQRAR